MAETEYVASKFEIVNAIAAWAVTGYVSAAAAAVAFGSNWAQCKKTFNISHRRLGWHCKRKTTTCTLFMYIPFPFTSLNSLQFHFRLRWILLLTSPHTLSARERVRREHIRTHDRNLYSNVVPDPAGRPSHTTSPFSQATTSIETASNLILSFTHFVADCVCACACVNSLRLRMKQEVCARFQNYSRNWKHSLLFCFSQSVSLCTTGQEKRHAGARGGDGGVENFF